MANSKHWLFAHRAVAAALSSLLLWMTPVSGLAAMPSGNRISWDEFRAQITPRHKIRMLLPDGAHVEGYPLAIRPDAVDLRVTRTSNKQAHPKGESRIPRSSFSVVEVRKPRRAGKGIGTLAPIGIGAGILAAGLMSSDDTTFYNGVVTGSCTMGFGGVAGFFVGRAIDRRFETVVILPEKPPVQSSVALVDGPYTLSPSPDASPPRK